MKDKSYKHIKDAHNKVMGNINMVKVWKGAGTKVKKDLSRDWDLFIKKHKLKKINSKSFSIGSVINWLFSTGYFLFTFNYMRSKLNKSGAVVNP